MGSSARGSDRAARSRGSFARGRDPEAGDRGRRARARGHEAHDRGPLTRGRDHEAHDRGPLTRGRDHEAHDRCPSAQGRGHEAHDRGPLARGHSREAHDCGPWARGRDRERRGPPGERNHGGGRLAGRAHRVAGRGRGRGVGGRRRRSGKAARSFRRTGIPGTRPYTRHGGLSSPGQSDLACVDRPPERGHPVPRRRAIDASSMELGGAAGARGARRALRSLQRGDQHLRRDERRLDGRQQQEERLRLQ